MLFKRRDKPPLHHRIRYAVYPRSGWRRAIGYLSLRVRRLPDTPHRIALGFACGVYMCFTPFFVIQPFLAMGLARLLRANMLAAFIGAFVGNPVTGPFIVWISLALGRRILGYGLTGRDFDRVVEAFSSLIGGLWRSILSLVGLAEPEWGRLAIFWFDLGMPFLVGGILPGLVCSITAYYILRPLIAAYQEARRARMLERARVRLAGAQSAADAGPNSAYDGAARHPSGE